MSELSGHFGLKRLFRFTYPSIIMLVFTSIYGVVDGFFISNYTGKMPFAAVNKYLVCITMLLEGTPNRYLADINQQVEQIFHREIKEMAEKQGVTEALKKQSSLGNG